MSTDLPPEAYTRDTLQAAFDWLQSQPEVLRNSVHTPDRLVSLYRKSQRLEDSDHPVSSKKFISDLKNLATSLDQFDGQPKSFDLGQAPSANLNPTTVAPSVASVVAPEPAPAPIIPPQPAPETAPLMPQSTPVTPMAPMAPMAPSLGTTQTTTQRVQKASFEVTTQTQETTTSQMEMDAVTMQRVESVKKRFNLSSSDEALRLLVAIGYEKFSNFP